MTTEEQIIEEVKQSVFNLVDRGECIANCPKCDIALSLSELKSSKCNQCGDIDLLSVPLFIVEHQA